MSIKAAIQDAMKDALRNKQTARLGTLRMAKAAILNEEKSGKGEVTDDVIVKALRSEVRKRQQTIEILTENGKDAEANDVRDEIAVLEEFLPQQLSREDLEAKVRTYLDEHPDVNHAGKLTGALKKELGDTADGKLLNEVCRAALGG